MSYDPEKKGTVIADGPQIGWLTGHYNDHLDICPGVRMYEICMEDGRRYWAQLDIVEKLAADPLD